MDNVTIPKEAESEFFAIRELSKGMLQITVKDNGELTIDDMRESVRLLDEFVNDKNFIALIDIRNSFMSVSPDALRFIGSQNDQLKFCKAEAIVVDSLAVSLIMNFYIKFIPKNKESKVFKSIGPAQSWLDSKKHLL